MSEQEYETLWHYSERFTRDKLQRSELVTMAYVQGKRMGKKCTPGLMKSVMHFRAKELKKRSAFPADEMGKSIKDAWNHEHCSLDQPLNSCRGERTIGDVVLGIRTSPLDVTITNEFIAALTDDERTVMDDLVAGYKMNEISKRHFYTIPRVNSLRRSVQEKAIEYL